MSESETIKTTCPYCGVGCGLRIRMQPQGPTVEPDPDHPSNLGRICTKGAALGETLDLEGRLLHPRIRGRRASWDEALDKTAAGFRHAVDRYGPDSVAFYVSGQLLTEDYYVANKLMKGFIGTANIDTNSRLCMSSAVAGHQRAFGEDVVPVSYRDLEQSDLIVLVGSNTAWCHPVIFQRIRAAREQRPDMQIVVIDPRRTATAAEADLHVPVRPGTDVVLFNGLLTYLARHGCVDEAFIAAHTEQYAQALEAAGGLELPEVARLCDVPEQDLAEFYRRFAQTQRTITLFSQGVNQSSVGTDKVNAIINCHLATGRINRPGMGPFSITGQPNAMGGREVGGLANTLAAHIGFDDESGVDGVRRFWDAPNLATRPGLKAVDLFAAIREGRIKAVWIMATNPLVSMPAADEVRQALAACELVVVSDCIADTDTQAYADISLPAAAWAEKDGTVTNSERRISRQRAFLPLPGEVKPDWWIVTEVARRMGYGEAFAYRRPADVFREHARLSAFENSGRRFFDLGALAELDDAAYDDLQPVRWPLPAGTAVGSFPAGEESAAGQLMAESEVESSGVEGPGVAGLRIEGPSVESLWSDRPRNERSLARIPSVSVAVPASAAGISASAARTQKVYRSPLKAVPTVSASLSVGMTADLPFGSLAEQKNEPAAQADAFRPIPVSYADNRFSTPSRKARFVATPVRDALSKTGERYPFVLNTGRVRDHWHTLTRTGKSPRLSAHIPEPFVAIHPQDAQQLGLAEGNLATVETRHGRALLRVQLDDGQRRGELFAPMHWNDRFAAQARIGALIPPHVDPISGEPEFKLTPAAIRPWQAAWHGFLLSRVPVTPGKSQGMEYWLKIRGRDHWRLELAGRERHPQWSLWARRLLGAVRADADWLEYTDPRAGGYRLAHVDADGRLLSCLFVAATPAALPNRDWLGGLFASDTLSAEDRMALLAGCLVSGGDRGAIVCSCHGVGRNEIADAIRGGAADAAAIGRQLKAGTECGSCLPEIRQLLAKAG